MDQVASQGPIPPELFCDSKSKNTVISGTNPHSLEKPKTSVEAYRAKGYIPTTFSNTHKETWRHTSVEAFASVCLIEVNITLGNTCS